MRSQPTTVIPSFKNLIGLYSDRVLRIPLAIFYPTQRCNLKCSSCSDWLIGPETEELSLQEIRSLAAQFKEVGAQRVVLSGGEPLLRPDIAEVVRAFAEQGLSLTLLTNGTYLGRRGREIEGLFDEVIVSIDGAAAETHDAIRGARCFDLILEGIASFKAMAPSVKMTLRTVVQKKNFREIPAIARLGRRLGVEKVSFLAADMNSAAFGRDRTQTVIDRDRHLLTSDEIAQLRGLLCRAADQEPDLLDIIAEPLPKLLRIADYYQAMIGAGGFPSVECQAPMVSLVVDSRGYVLPCYFLDRVANVRTQSLRQILNGAALRRIRREKRQGRIEKCRTCVCSLKVTPRAALANRF